MVASSARQDILRLLSEAGPRAPGDPVSFATLRSALSRHPKGTLSARLSELVAEGLLTKDRRARYRLARSDEKPPETLRALAALLKERQSDRALMQTVIWEATPFLRTFEDGQGAPVLVVETPRFTGGATADLIREHGKAPLAQFVQEFSDRQTLLEAVMGNLRLPASKGATRILVGPCEGKLAATTLTRGGFRIARAERILADFLAFGDPNAAEPIRMRLTSPSANLNPDSLFAAARERDILPSLFVVANELRASLPPRLRESFAEKLRLPARSLVEDTL